MPQIAQLPDIFWSQLFWLAIIFGIIFFVIGRGMLPKIQATVDARDAKIAEDLAGAERARAEATETETAYRARLDESRAEATRVTQASKQDMLRASEARIKSADVEIQGRTKAAEDRIREASGAAMKEVETVAADIAQELVSKLAGLQVSQDRAAAAVKAALNG